MTTKTSSDSVRLIFTDLKNNNNKWWHAEIVGQNVLVSWGRVGDVGGQKKTFPFASVDAAQKFIKSKSNEKLRKGYTHQQTMGDTFTPTAKVAKIQIQHNNDPETSALIDFLIKRNIHNIEGMTSIRVEAGRLTTPLGPVTEEGLDQAQKLLLSMSKQDAQFDNYVNQYLRIIPRNIGRRKVDPKDLFGTQRQLEQEQTTIDSLRAVVKDFEQKAATDTAAAPPIFATKLELLSPSSKDWSRIEKYYKNTSNSRHQSAGFKLKQIWIATIESCEKDFNDKIGNVKELWHGTKDANLLSILKQGYVIPKRNSGIAITGRMFGDGIYFSDQSTKSLNYATGYWGGGRSPRSFMFLNDVAMGKEYVPRSSFSGTIPKGYDSCFAQPGKSGIMNNEMIIYSTSQVRPTYLCEFG